MIEKRKAMLEQLGSDDPTDKIEDEVMALEATAANQVAQDAEPAQAEAPVETPAAP